MKRLAALVIAILCFNTITAQQKEIRLETEFGSNNKEIHQILRF